MYRDPELSWHEEFPYDVLAPAGITPQSTMADILDAMGYFTQQGQVAEVLQAWNDLQTIKRRLFIDFFLYRINKTGEST